MLFGQVVRKGTLGYFILWLNITAAAAAAALGGQSGGQAGETNSPGEQVMKMEKLYQVSEPLLTDSQREEIRLTLQDSIHRALAHNLDIRIGGYDPAIRLCDIVSAEAAFDSVLFGSAQFDISDRDNIESGFFNRSITTNSGTRQVRVPTDPFTNLHDYNYMMGLRKLLPTGASIQLAEQLRRLRDLNDEDALFRNPFYEFGLQFQLRQPLLRDFGIDVNRSAILASRNNHRISQQQFHLLVIQTSVEVETNYWRLFFARQRVNIFANLVNRAQESLQRILQREDYDVSSRVVARTQAVIKKAQANLVAARSAVLQQQDLLLESLNDPELSLEKKWEIIPEDKPNTASYEVDYPQAVHSALQERPEIIAQRLRMDTAGLAEGVAENQRLPRLDLFYQQETTGAGDQYGSSWDQQWQNETINYLFGFSFEVPVGNRAAEASLNKTRKQREQEKLRLQSIREQVLADVNISMHKLHSKYEEIGVRLEAAEADNIEVLNYLAIQDTQRQDSTTPEFINLKLNADERLANSQITAAQTMIEYNLAIMDIYRAQGTLLRYNNIQLAELGGSLRSNVK